jgi:hypothetical protein
MTFLPSSYSFTQNVSRLRERVVMDLLDLGINPSEVKISFSTSGAESGTLSLLFPDGVINHIKLEG